MIAALSLQGKVPMNGNKQSNLDIWYGLWSLNLVPVVKFYRLQRLFRWAEAFRGKKIEPITKRTDYQVYWLSRSDCMQLPCQLFVFVCLFA